MDIRHVAERINKYAHLYDVSKLQEIRQDLNNLTRVPTYAIFTGNSIFPKDHYAYHAGGRTELQYNIGFESPYLFRYGLAFSLEPGQSLPDPVSVFSSRIEKFNQYLTEHIDELSDLYCWYYARGERSKTRRVAAIKHELVRPGVFIFIGKYFKKSADELSEGDYRKILTLFDRLLPVYEHVEGTSSEERVARLCWNTNDWQSPSGRIGKSHTNGLYEEEHGFGHEEWLLDTTRIVDGWHYGFLQGVHKHRRKYLDSKITLHLYTINAETSQRYWLGKIRNAEVISEEKSKEIFKHYKKNGWFDEMLEELRFVRLDTAPFRETRPEIFCNLRFKVSDLGLLDEPEEFDADDEAVVSTRYTTLPRFIRVPRRIVRTYDFQFRSGHFERRGRTGRNSNTRVSAVDLAHNRMQTAIYNQLSTEYGRNNVGTEVDAGFGVKIDIVVRNGDDHYFYELKTDNSIKMCIRQALGQLLEYAHWPDRTVANRLIIVSPSPITEESRKYLRFLRKTLKLNVYYQYFQVETAKLAPKLF